MRNGERLLRRGQFARRARLLATLPRGDIGQHRQLDDIEFAAGLAGDLADFGAGLHEHIGAFFGRLAADPGLAAKLDRAADKITDLRIFFDARRNLRARRETREANARAAERAHVLMLDAVELAIADPWAALRLHHDRLVEARLGELDLVPGDVFGAGEVRILVDLPAVWQDLRIDAAFEGAAFGRERLARVAELFMGEIADAGQALELQA